MSVAVIALRLIESVSASPIAPLAKDMMRFCGQIKSTSKIAYQAHATVAAFKDAKSPPTPIMRLCQRIWAFAQVAYSVFELVGAPLDQGLGPLAGPGSHYCDPQPLGFSVSASPIAPLAKDMMRVCGQIKSASKIAYQAHATVAAFKDAKSPPTPIMRLCQRIWAFAQVAYSVFELVGLAAYLWTRPTTSAASATPPEASALPAASAISSGPPPPPSATLPARALAATISSDDASSSSGNSSDDDDWVLGLSGAQLGLMGEDLDHHVSKKDMNYVLLTWGPDLDNHSDAQADFNANLPKIRSWASVGRNLASWGRTLTIM
eukprot:gene9562-12147_t